MRARRMDRVSGHRFLRYGQTDVPWDAITGLLDTYKLIPGKWRTAIMRYVADAYGGHLETSRSVTWGPGTEFYDRTRARIQSVFDTPTITATWVGYEASRVSVGVWATFTNLHPTVGLRLGSSDMREFVDDVVRQHQLILDENEMLFNRFGMPPPFEILEVPE